MLKYSNFSELLLEALRPEERSHVDTWAKGDNSFSEHLFAHSPDENRASFDLEHPTAGHRSDIEEHIRPHGFEVKDYQKGIAKDKYGRDVNIGRVLHRTKAHPDLKKKFDNDPSRQQLSATSNTHKIIISRHPHDVAGMTSHGHSWECESCMNFNSGVMRHYLPSDVRHGTHVAYLVDKDDDNIERPLARISLKRYTNLDDPDDHILRPEHKTYGDAPDAFHHTVNKLIDRYFPGKKGASYKKHDDVYDDSSNRFILHKDSLANHISTNDIRLSQAIREHPHLSKEHIDKLAEYNPNEIMSIIRHNENLSKESLEHIRKNYSDINGGNDRNLIDHFTSVHKNAPQQWFDEHAKQPKSTMFLSSIISGGIKNGKLKKEHIGTLVNKTIHHDQLASILKNDEVINMLSKDEHDDFINNHPDQDMIRLYKEYSMHEKFK